MPGTDSVSDSLHRCISRMITQLAGCVIPQIPQIAILGRFWLRASGRLTSTAGRDHASHAMDAFWR